MVLHLLTVVSSPGVARSAPVRIAWGRSAVVRSARSGHLTTNVSRPWPRQPVFVRTLLHGVLARHPDDCRTDVFAAADARACRTYRQRRLRATCRWLTSLHRSGFNRVGQKGSP